MILFAAAGEVMTLLKVILLAKHHSFQIIICEFDFAIYSQHFQNNFIRYHGMLPWDHFHSLAFNKIYRFSKWGKTNLFFFSLHLYSRIKIILSKVQFVMSRPVEINQSINLPLCGNGFLLQNLGDDFQNPTLHAQSRKAPATKW